MTVRTRVATILAIVTTLLAVWTVVPAPTRLLLPLGVAAPELSPWLLLVSITIVLLAGSARRGTAGRRRAAAMAAVGAACAMVPLAQVSVTTARAEAAMRDALGATYAVDPAGLAAPAISVRGALLGLDAPDARVTRGIVTDTADGVVLRTDVFHPAGAAPHPAVVVVYGGAWQRGEPADMPRLSHHLASRGYVVFAVDYRHAPRFRHPAARDDVRGAVAWVRAQAADYGVDTARIALLGRSSGAHLAMLAAYDGAQPVRAVIDFYGPVDLARGYARPPTPDPLDVRAVLRTFIGGTPDELPDRYREASPITLVRAAAASGRRLPPTLIVHGTRDHVVRVEFSRELRDALRAARTPVALLEIPWAEHAFDAVPFGPGSQLALHHVERFLAWAMPD